MFIVLGRMELRVGGSGARTVIVKLPLAVFPELSWTVTLTGKVAAFAGVPVSAPLRLRLRPSFGKPDITVKK
jgi:hypothetical protein